MYRARSTQTKRTRQHDSCHAALFCDRVCKPGSVIDSHLSRRSVAAAFQPPSRKQPGQPCFLCGVAPDRVYSDGCFHTIGGALTAPFHPYPTKAGRYLSVALFLKLPSAGVTRYPCPVEPGLSSCTAFRHCTRDCPTRSRCYCTLSDGDCQMDCISAACRI